MSINSIFQNFGLVINEIKEDVNCELNKTRQDMSNLPVTLMAASKKAIKKFVMYYPQTTIVALVAQTIFTAMNPSLGKMISLASSAALLYPLKRHIMVAMKLYGESGLSELNSFQEKKDLLTRIEVIAQAGNIIDSAKNHLNNFRNKVSSFFN